jgi:hypothetical protein
MNESGFLQGSAVPSEEGRVKVLDFGLAKLTEPAPVWSKYWNGERTKS